MCRTWDAPAELRVVFDVIYAATLLVNERAGATQGSALQQTGVVEHVDDLGYYVQLVLRHMEPYIEGFNHLSPNVLAGDCTNVSKRFQ